MRLLLTGAGGQLASDLARALSAEPVHAMTHAQLDISNAKDVAATVHEVQPECILNAAAFNLVDACEDRGEEAFRINTLGVCNLARAAQERGAALVHFSTNYVFDGQKKTPYTETDLPRPLSVYGMSKLGGEWAARQYCERHFVIRTAALYGAAGNKSKGGNFLERMARAARDGKPLRVVNDQFVNPTYTWDLAQKVAQLLPTRAYGLYHMVNTGACSWFDFARAAFERLGIQGSLNAIPTAELTTKARRPVNSTLENAALCKAGVADLRPWQEALQDYLKEFLV